MQQASFVERYATKRQDGSNNSKFQAIILEETKKAQEAMAAAISQANSSEANMTATLLQFPEHEAPKSAEEAELEQAVDDKSVETLLKRIEAATSPEELTALLEEYETALAEWKEKITSLRSEKHLKEIFAIEAALNMLREMMKNPALQQGQQIAEQLRQGLQSQQQRIAEQAQRSLQQNIQLQAMLRQPITAMQEMSRQQMMAAASRPQVMPVHQQQNTALDSNRIAQQNAAQRQAQQQAEQAMRYAATTAAVNQQRTVQQVAATIAAVNHNATVATLAATQQAVQQTAVIQATQQQVQAEGIAATTQQQAVNNAIAEKQASQEAAKPAITDKQASTVPIEVKTAAQPATTTPAQSSVSENAGTQSIAKAEATKDVAVSAAREQSQQEQAMQQGGQKLGRYAQVIANSRCKCTEQQSVAM